MKLGYERFPFFPEVPFPLVKEALLQEDEDRPRAMIAHHSNPVLVQANEKRTKQALKNLEFLMVNEIYPTATSEIADLVLPITSDFESYGYRAYSSVEGGFLAMGRPIADPPGLSRPVFEVEYELAERMGLHQNYPFHDTMSWLSFMIKPSGVTFEQLEAEQIVYATPPIRYRKYEKKGFNTPSGKLEFFSKSYREKGCSALPVYSDPAGELLKPENLIKEGLSLLGTSMRPSQFVHTKLKNIDALSKSYPEPFVWMNPEDANTRGVKEGQIVKVTSPQGMVKITARLTENTKPGLIWIDFGWGNPTDKKASMNVLTNDRFLDPISGGTPNRLFPCEVVKE
jgi:anaerobic selenocysteine-containing dehydrogenase